MPIMPTPCPAEPRPVAARHLLLALAGPAADSGVRYLAVGPDSLADTDTSEGDEVVLLLNGGSVGHRQWNPVAPLLSLGVDRDGRVLILDSTGTRGRRLAADGPDAFVMDADLRGGTPALLVQADDGATLVRLYRAR